MTSIGTIAEHIIPFRSRTKLSEHNVYYDNQRIPKFIPKKQKHYQIHHLHGINTWMIDYLYIKPNGAVINEEIDEDTEDKKKRDLITILAMMHCNSRLFVAFIVENKGADVFHDLLFRYFITGNDMEPTYGVFRPRINILISDYEKAFGLDVRKNNKGKYEIIPDKSGRDHYIATLYKNRCIEHIGYNASADKGAHAKLALIDRMARTLRDMIFNARRNNPSFTLNQDTLRQLCKYYNHTSHSTLSSIMGFKVTPYDAYMNRDLQNEICRRIMEQNYNTINRINGERIDVGTEVWVYQPPIFGKKRRNNVEDDPYEVIELLGPAGYRVRNKNTGIEKIRTRMNLVTA